MRLVSCALAIFALALFYPAVAEELADCRSDDALDYLCGPEKPEDVLALPGTRWLIASGFTDGAGLKLVDTQARRYRKWFAGDPAKIDWDKERYPECPGVLDPAVFNARGLSLRPQGDGRWRLLAVNHGGRESIEIFTVTAGAGAPSLAWRGCIPMPEGQVANSVASFSDGEILATVLTRPGTTIADFVQERVTGGVWRWRPGDASFALMPGTELPGNNGLETDPDDRRFYVVAFGLRSVFVFDRRDARLPPRRILAPDFMPDNIHWSAGRLLLAGMRYDEPACGGLRPVIAGVADPMLCHRGWVVGEIDFKNDRISTVAYGGPQEGFSGISSAAIVNGELWLGSFQKNRLARVTNWIAEPAPR